jgi:hypothetical protein
VNVVLVEEQDPPLGEAPIQWILVTTLPIDNFDQIQLIIGYDKIRWQIEVYFNLRNQPAQSHFKRESGSAEEMKAIESQRQSHLGTIESRLSLSIQLNWLLFFPCH